MAGVTVEQLGRIAASRWGLVTTAQAEAAGIPRKTMSRLAATGVLERIAQGVYRAAGAPELEHEPIYAAWLALSDLSPTPPGQVPGVVAAGETAAILHGIGDFYPDGSTFIVPSRRGTRLEGVRLRTRTLQPDEVAFAEGVPALTVERTIADLVDVWTDRSLVADTIADAAAQGKLVAPQRLATYLDTAAAANGYSTGAEFADDLLALAGAAPVGKRG